MFRGFLVALFLVCSVSFSFAAGAVKIKYSVAPIKQPSVMSCWATASTMLWNWKNVIPNSIGDVVKLAGPKFQQLYKDSFDNDELGTKGEGINPTDEKAFYDALSLQYIVGLNPSIAGWAKMLKEKGPLSITVKMDPATNYFHALVVIGLDGDGTAENTIVSYNDPAYGVQFDLIFSEFLKLYEGAVNWPLQIVHYP